MSADQKHEPGQNTSVNLFKSVSKEEFDRLPRPSAEDIQRALDAGRSVEIDPGGPALCLDPAARFF